MRFPIEMYRIREEDVKIKVPCEWCVEKGIVDKKCNKCGGNGTHNKTIKVWKVAPRTTTVEKINRSSMGSHLRYWTGCCEFYKEEDRYLHFNKTDAQNECDRRNVDIADILKIHNSNKDNYVELVFIEGDRINGIAMSDKGVHYFMKGKERFIEKGVCEIIYGDY